MIDYNEMIFRYILNFNTFQILFNQNKHLNLAMDTHIY